MARIILIDDDHGPTDYYVKALRIKGFEVLHLDSLERALDHIKNESSLGDLYILDLMMAIGSTPEALLPKSSYAAVGYGLTAGLLVFQELRQRLPTVPVILLSAVSRADLVEKMPMDEFTTREAKINVRPFRLPELVADRLSSERTN